MIYKLNNEALYFGLIFIGIIFIAVSIFISNSKIHRLRQQVKAYKELVDIIPKANSSDNALIELLRMIGSIAKALTCALYFFDEKSGSYTLRAVLQQCEDQGNITPSYSGLSPYSKDKYFMPPTFQEQPMSQKTLNVKCDELPFIQIPLQQTNGFILISTARFVNKKVIKRLDALNASIQAVVKTIIEMEKLYKGALVAVSSGSEVKNISNILNDTNGMLETLIRISTKAVNAKGGLFASVYKEKIDMVMTIGLEHETAILIKQDEELILLLKQLLSNKKVASVSKSDKYFFKLPPYFVAEEIEQILILDVSLESRRGMVVLWFDTNAEINVGQLTALQIFSKRIGEVLDHQLTNKDASYSYISMLKQLANTVDNFKASTVGYSELMYRYAMMISKELRISSEEIKEIALAAYLSNIGVLGLSDEILLKKGKYTDVEYEMMKLHADVGASIIEITTGNSKLASYVRHHHECMNGYGYPEGLKGEDIPIGSRVIAVVQMFLAKLLARGERDAIPFHEAIEQLEAVCGTQLDDEIVNALVKWFTRKQDELKNMNRSLGPCWEMRCCPEIICRDCPSFGDTNKNCWENPTNNCEDHGNQCQSCFVHTEYLYRMKN